MQDFHSIPGLADRIFGGGGGGGGAENRRMRGYPGGCVGAQEPPAKCPRCESTNTKFCYYNNYNLSQPRHFCKSCRRYWTKGGVLRNVPVGGGCRKSSSSSSSKRSSSSPSKKSSSKDRRRSPAAASRSRSSSDSSSLTAAAAEASASASASASTSASGAASASPFFADPALFPPHNPSRSTDFDPEKEMEPPPAMIPGSDIFSETGTFTSLMTGAGAPAFLGLNFSDPSPPPPPLQFGVHQPLHHRNGTASHGFETDREIRIQGLTSGRIDQTVPIDLPPQQQDDQFDGRMCGGDAAAAGGMEWPTATEQLLFDFSGGLDPGAYWNQSQWSDTDPASLYLP